MPSFFLKIVLSVSQLKIHFKSRLLWMILSICGDAIFGDVSPIIKPQLLRRYAPVLAVRSYGRMSLVSFCPAVIERSYWKSPCWLGKSSKIMDYFYGHFPHFPYPDAILVCPLVAYYTIPRWVWHLVGVDFFDVGDCFGHGMMAGTFGVVLVIEVWLSTLDCASIELSEIGM